MTVSALMQASGREFHSGTVLTKNVAKVGSMFLYVLCDCSSAIDVIVDRRYAAISFVLNFSPDYLTLKVYYLK